MQIGEPVRTVIVEPLELPVNEPPDDLEFDPEPLGPDPEPDPVPASV